MHYTGSAGPRQGLSAGHEDVQHQGRGKSLGAPGQIRDGPRCVPCRGRRRRTPRSPRRSTGEAEQRWLSSVVRCPRDRSSRSAALQAQWYLDHVGRPGCKDLGSVPVRSGSANSLLFKPPNACARRVAPRELRGDRISSASTALTSPPTGRRWVRISRTISSCELRTSAPGPTPPMTRCETRLPKH